MIILVCSAAYCQLAALLYSSTKVSRPAKNRADIDETLSDEKFSIRGRMTRVKARPMPGGCGRIKDVIISLVCNRLSA